VSSWHGTKTRCTATSCGLQLSFADLSDARSRGQQEVGVRRLPAKRFHRPGGGVIGLAFSVEGRYRFGVLAEIAHAALRESIRRLEPARFHEDHRGTEQLGVNAPGSWRFTTASSWSHTNNHTVVARIAPALRAPPPANRSRKRAPCQTLSQSPHLRPGRSPHPSPTGR
jgi:hypothetical protein